MELTDRKKQILKVVIEDYVATAEPVSSKVIAKQLPTKVSSATIRNDLADLVELGYLVQPHTSSGRVPLPKGYRLYVNELMERQRLSVRETEKINASLHLKLEELDRVIAQVGQSVSRYVNYPSYVAASGTSSLSARHFELLPVDESSCIVVMMTSDSRVKSKLMRLQLSVATENMPKLAKVLNTHFIGLSPTEMNLRLMKIADQITPPLFLLLSQAVSYAADILIEAGHREVFTAGASQLLKLPEFRDADKAHDLMQFLAEEKDALPSPDEDRPMKILIGPENVNSALQDTSVVVASYDIGDNMRGLIGVVGPTRMDYASVAARLNGFAGGLTRLFGKKDLPQKEEPKHE